MTDEPFSGLRLFAYWFLGALIGWLVLAFGAWGLYWLIGTLVRM